MTTRTRAAILVLALIGFSASAFSTYVHYQLIRDPSYVSVCDVNQSVSCTQVYLSRFGSVGGVPVAIGGAFWFGLVGLLAFAGGRGPSEFRQALPTYLLILSTLGLAVVLYLGYASLMVLDAVCVACLTVYAAVIGIFLLSGSGTPVPFLRVPGQLARDLGYLVRRPVALTVAVAFVAAVGGLAGWFARAETGSPVASAAGPSTPGADQQSEFQRWWETQPRVSLDVPADGARVVVAKFNDYQCPSCAQTFFSYEGIVAKYRTSHPDAVKFISLDYPLDAECNPESASGPHPAACEAAVAVRLAREAGEAERMERWLFTNQTSLTPESIEQALREIAGVESFKTRYDEILEAVKKDIALGTALQVDATPTFVINGIKVRGGLPPEFFDAAIASELQRTEGS